MEALIEIGKVENRYSNSKYSKLIGYQIRIFHRGLNEQRIIIAPEIYLLEAKANLQIQKWNDLWHREVSSQNANLKSLEAQKAIADIENILYHTLSINDSLQWDKLKDCEKFIEENPSYVLEQKINLLQKPTRTNLTPLPIKKILPLPSKPDSNSKKYKYRPTFIDKLFSSKRKYKESLLMNEYQKDISEWEKECNLIYAEFDKKYKEIELANKKILDAYNKELEKYELEKQKCISENEILCSEWEKRKTDFYKNQEEYNLKIDKLKEAYLNQDEEAIIDYCGRVLSNSEYPDSFPKGFMLEYNKITKTLIIEYKLPSMDCFPNIKEVKYLAIQKEFKEIHLSDNQMNKMFDDAIYKITLRTLHEIFEADCINAIDAVSFNGWINSINKATGRYENNCIVSIYVKKNEFLMIDLANVDAKTCFKNLKGISGSKLNIITPIQPIMQINKTDNRFIEPYSVVEEISNTTNIAIMDWEDFEHLIRELFEKEFESNGGEVKVTQTSRDGGVDAIAFDPDPIRGGKIVIQAKRYSNTVGVSAVRDLYGTVLNEGATKGILVSTADYGPEAYEFAKGKPLTLLNGANLLHLLEKHGYHAKIDLQEARKILSNK